MAKNKPEDSLAEKLDSDPESAARRIDEEFRGRLNRLAEKLLDGRIRGRLDPEDVVQSVFKSFFRYRSAKPESANDRFELWRLLATIVRRKCIRAAQKHLGPSADTRREASLDVSPVESVVMTPPEAMASMADLWKRLMGRLDHPHRAVCELRFEGHELSEIAQALKVSTRTVERKMARIRRQLESLVE